jgi:hypothetical protein
VYQDYARLRTDYGEHVADATMCSAATDATDWARGVR